MGVGKAVGGDPVDVLGPEHRCRRAWPLLPRAHGGDEFCQPPRQRTERVGRRARAKEQGGPPAVATVQGDRERSRDLQIRCQVSDADVIAGQLDFIDAGPHPGRNRPVIDQGRRMPAEPVQDEGIPLDQLEERIRQRRFAGRVGSDPAGALG